MCKDTFRKYSNTFIMFVEFIGLEPGQVPKTEDFKRFIVDLIDKQQYAASSVECMYSHCQKAAVELFEINLNSTKSIFDAIKWYKKGSTQKKAKAFESYQLNKYFKLIDLKDDWMLVRAVVAIVAFFGGLRIKEVKDIMYGGKSIFTWSCEKQAETQKANVVNKIVCIDFQT